jgi:hypothetical protein
MAEKRLSYRQQRTAALESRRNARTTAAAGPTFRLSVPDALKNPELEYRWINDDAKGRLFEKTGADTWDYVTSEEIALDNRNSGTGTRIERVVGTAENGEPLKAFLCCKPKAWYAEDEAARLASHSELMAQIRREPVSAVPAGLAADREHAYTPAEARMSAAA